jgi:hypothetical protein
VNGIVNFLIPLLLYYKSYSPLDETAEDSMKITEEISEDVSSSNSDEEKKFVAYPHRWHPRACILIMMTVITAGIVASIVINIYQTAEGQS